MMCSIANYAGSGENGKNKCIEFVQKNDADAEENGKAINLLISLALALTQLALTQFVVSSFKSKNKIIQIFAEIMKSWHRDQHHESIDVLDAKATCQIDNGSMRFCSGHISIVFYRFYAGNLKMYRKMKVRTYSGLWFMTLWIWRIERIREHIIRHIWAVPSRIFESIDQRGTRRRGKYCVWYNCSYNHGHDPWVIVLRCNNFFQ